MESLAMGGYGAYVWSSFGLMFAVVIVTIVQARVRHNKMLHEIKVRIEAMERQL
jgi:heme exporter protein CcmD